MAKKSVIIRADIKDLEFATAEDLMASEQLRNLIMWSVPRSIEESIKSNKQTAPIFQIGTSNYYLELPKSSWISSLETVMEYRATQDTKEGYEECAKIRNLLEKVMLVLRLDRLKVTQNEESTIQSTENSSRLNPKIDNVDNKEGE